MDTMPIGRYGPWYRGGVSRSYVPPTVFASVGFAICLIFFGVFMIFVGGIITGISHQKPQPPFDTEFFTKGKENDPLRVIGPVLLGIGLTVLLIAVILCCVAGVLAKRQENRRHERAAQPLNTGALAQPPPASAYPHQPQTQPYYPPGPVHPMQPQGQHVAESCYQPQPQSRYPPGPVYPTQPQGQYDAGSYYSPQPQSSCPPGPISLPQSEGFQVVDFSSSPKHQDQYPPASPYPPVSNSTYPSGN